MKYFQFALRDFFFLTAVVAAGLGVHVTFGNAYTGSHTLWLGWYLIALSLLTALCFLGRASLRGIFLTTTIFGWAYLLCVLKLSFWGSPSEARGFADDTKVGLMLLGVCFLIAFTVFGTARKQPPIQA